ncbi:hypothetical protein BH10BAC3_BH10BAC3_04220 [soil metagenome]
MSIAMLFSIYLNVAAVATVFLIIALVNTYRRGTNKSVAKKLQSTREERDFVPGKLSLS